MGCQNIRNEEDREKPANAINNVTITWAEKLIQVTEEYWCTYLHQNLAPVSLVLTMYSIAT